MNPPRIAPRGTVILAGPDTEYRVLGLSTSGANAELRLRTVDGLDWSADRPPREPDPEVTRREDRAARAAYLEQGRPPESLAAARVAIEHVEHHGQPLRFVGTHAVGDLVEHRFACRERGCRFVLTWSTTS